MNASPLPHGDLNSSGVMLNRSTNSIRLAEFYLGLIYGKMFNEVIQQSASRSWRDQKSIRLRGVDLRYNRTIAVI